MMKKRHLPKGSKRFWDKISIQEKRFNQIVASYPFIRKLEILEELMDRARLIRNAR